jgi:2-methylcitrate dehydratase PrpD
MTISGELAGWVAGLSLADVPEDARAAACRHLLDGIGVTVAAARMGEAGATVAVARALGGPAEASLLDGSGDRLSAPAAALANGGLLHALDFDDTHAGGIVHPTATVLPAALAVGQQVGASGAQVLEAALAGYEVVCRIAAAAPHAFHARGAHPTSVCGVFASAAVAAKLTGLSAQQTRDALGIAGSQSSGLMQFLHGGADTKLLHPAWAAMAGILAARLADAGLSGPAAVLEGEFGTYRVFAGRDVDPAAVLDGLGSSWEVTRITVKPYPACHLLHAAVDAAALLRDQVAVDAIDQIVADVAEASIPVVCEPVAEKLAPPTPYAAKFSLQHSVAAMLIDGAVDATTYTPDAVRRPDVLRLSERVTCRAVAWDGSAAAAPGRLEARTTGGDTVVASVPQSGGGPDDPNSLHILRDKALRNLGGTPAAEAAAAAVMELSQQPSADAVIDLVTAAMGASDPTTNTRTPIGL